jgi:predicted metalloendopeptidase
MVGFWRTCATTLALGTLMASPVLGAFITPEGGDASIRPQDDFFRHVNGAWLDATEIPADKRAYGTFLMLRERSNQQVRELLEKSAPKGAAASAESKLAQDYYHAKLHGTVRPQAAVAMLKPLLDRINSLRTSQAALPIMVELVEWGVDGPLVPYVYADSKEPARNAVYVTQAGLGLPDRDYYLKTDAASVTLRQDYLAYVTQVLALAGDKRAAKVAQGVLDFETALARLHWTRVENRDAVKTYNRVGPQELATRFEGVRLDQVLAALRVAKDATVVVNQPSYLEKLGELLAKTPLDTLKHYARWRVLDAYAEELGEAFRKAHHGFKGVKLNGLKEEPPAWRRAVLSTEGVLGEAIGKAYVDAHFPASAKARLSVLVDNLITVYRQALGELEWMTPATRAEALKKLAAFRVKIGYPDRWRAYTGVAVRRDDPLGNVIRVTRFNVRRELAEAGQTVDRARWSMTPQTVNAYYSPVGNEIVFPAAILQPPFFDPAADDAYNYGAIGSVIGHEISHGFDDQGRRYDGTGQLRDWWTTADEQAFNAKAAALVEQYAAYEPLSGVHVDGRLTLGENIADLAGVAMALRAYQWSRGDRPDTIVDGLTGAQRFFVGYGRVWRSKSREEWLRQRLATDPHSPEMCRVNGVVTNLDAFYQAYGLQPGDRLYREPAQRIRIW